MNDYLSFRIFPTEVCVPDPVTMSVFPSLKVDGLAFEGGGTRAPTHDLAVLVLALRTLGVTVPQLLTSIKYFGSNSGGSWTNAVLMAYQELGAAFPLDAVATQPTTPTTSWRTFYYDNWLQPIKAAVPGGLLAFETFTAENLAFFSWYNSLAKFFMVPFADALLPILLKNALFPVAGKKVVAFSTSVLFKSYLRTAATPPVNPLTNLDYIEYSWSNIRSAPPGLGVDIQGGPANFICGFSNTEITPISRFNLPTGSEGTVVYTTYNTATPGTGGTSTSARAVQNPSASSGDISIYFLSAISSASLSLTNTPWALQELITKPGVATTPAEARDVNLTVYNKTVIYEASTDKVIPNTANSVSVPLPNTPHLDNGIMSTTDLSGNTVAKLNIGDGVPFSSDTGLISVIRAIQGYETYDGTRTFELLYLASQNLLACSTVGEDLGFDSVFTSLFGLDFQDLTNTFENGIYTRHDVLGLDLPPAVSLKTASPQIFETTAFKADVAWPSLSVQCTYDTAAWPGLEGTRTAVRIVRFRNLVTINNDAYGIVPSWSFNITAVVTYSNLPPFIPPSNEPFEPLAKTNQKLMAQLQKLNEEVQWIPAVFG